MPVEKFKERFYIFLKGISPAQLEELLHAFWERKFPSKFNQELLQIIDKQKKDDTKIVCISASPALFLKPVTEKSGIDVLIGTELIYENNRYKVTGKNCRGYEKMTRLKKEFDLDRVKIVQAYGNSTSDIFILGLAEESFFMLRKKIIRMDPKINVENAKV